jgi:hypothetical protein
MRIEVAADRLNELRLCYESVAGVLYRDALVELAELLMHHANLVGFGAAQLDHLVSGSQGQLLAQYLVAALRPAWEPLPR